MGLYVGPFTGVAADLHIRMGDAFHARTCSSRRRRHSSQSPQKRCIVAMRGIPVRSEATSHSIDLVGPSERRVRHAGEFLAEILQLRFIQPIRVQGIHLEILSCSPFVRLL
jgi:hypothetical protein